MAALGEAAAGCSPLSVEEAVAVHEAYEAFARATCSPCAWRAGRREAVHPARGRRRLGAHLSRVQQLQRYATDLLVEAVGEPKHARAGLRVDVIEALRLTADGSPPQDAALR
jgi:hypothetical protein